ncbi:MAG: alpha/beta fold hydrolase, partial [Methyloligellaceae bacterium]
MTRKRSNIVTSLLTAAAIGVALIGAGTQSAVATETAVEARPTITDVRYRKAKIQGIDIAYREAGSADRPAIVLLHGFPTSSHMFRELIPILAKR